ncbi:MAG: TonB-dependent receptor plug domain-containing protein, partial [Endomicrobiales bacterium]
SGIVTASRNASGGWRANSDYEGRNFFTRLGYDAKDLGVFDLSGSIVRSGNGVPGLALQDPLDPFSPGLSPGGYNGNLEKTASTPNARQKDARDYLRLEHTKTFSDNSLKTSLYASKNMTDYSDPDPSPFSGSITNDRYTSLVFGGEGQYSLRHGLTLGTEWWQEMYKHDDLTTGAEKLNRQRVTTAGFLQDEFKAGKFSLIPGIRLDANSVFGSVFSPRFSVIHRTGERLKLSANIGKSWRAPTFNELYYPLDSWGMSGNPDLVPEEGISSDIGAEYAQEQFRSSLTLFLTDTKNLIHWGLRRPENIGKSRQAGAEFEMSRKIAAGLFGRLNYTYLWAEDTENRVVLNYRPHHTFNYGLTYLTAFGMRVSAGARYIGAQRTGDMTTPELPGYTVLNAGITQKIRDVEIWVTAENIGNAMYQTRLGYPLPGLAFQTGLTMRFWE